MGSPPPPHFIKFEIYQIFFFSPPPCWGSPPQKQIFGEEVFFFYFLSPVFFRILNFLPLKKKTGWGCQVFFPGF